MKHLIVFFFLALSVTAFAQEQPDSTAVSYETRNGVFYSVTRNFFPSGRILTQEDPLGRDTASVVNAVLGPVFTANSQFAQMAVVVAFQNRQLQQVNAASQLLTSLVGIDYADVMDNIVKPEILPDSLQSIPLTMEVNGTPVAGEFRRNNNGRLVYRQGGTNFRVEILSRNWIRLRRYQGTATETVETGVRVDLYLLKPGTWISLDRRYRLRYE